MKWAKGTLVSLSSLVLHWQKDFKQSKDEIKLLSLRREGEALIFLAHRSDLSQFSFSFFSALVNISRSVQGFRQTLAASTLLSCQDPVSRKHFFSLFIWIIIPSQRRRFINASVSFLRRGDEWSLKVDFPPFPIERTQWLLEIRPQTRLEISFTSSQTLTRCLMAAIFHVFNTFPKLFTKDLAAE